MNIGAMRHYTHVNVTANGTPSGTATTIIDASRGLCKCGNDEWRSLPNGTWSSVMSPYEQRFVDVKYTSAVYGSVIVTLLEVTHMVGSTCTSASHASRIKMLITRLCSPFSYETLGFVNFKLYELINLKYLLILDPRLKALAAGGEKEIQSEVSFELGSGGGLMQAGVVAGAEVVGGLVATFVVNGILGPGST
ncbi:hypothetical protein Tco_0832308 [Tanacetum coccineum]